MKKLILILSIFLVSCGYAPINNIEKIIITDVETANNGVDCNYYGWGDRWMVITVTNDKFKFRDTCGKFQIGDTLNIIKQ